MSFIVHACDISNPVQKFADFRDWGIRITQEFQDVYDSELDLQKIYGDEKSGAGGVASPLPMFKYKDYKSFAGGQVFFTKAFVLPTWQILVRLLPRIGHLVTNIEQNIAAYQ